MSLLSRQENDKLFIDTTNGDPVCGRYYDMYKNYKLYFKGICYGKRFIDVLEDSVSCEILLNVQEHTKSVWAFQLFLSYSQKWKIRDEYEDVDDKPVHRYYIEENYDGSLKDRMQED